MSLAIPPLEFVLVSLAAALVLMMIGLLIFRRQFRVEGVTWLALALLGPLPAAAGITLAELCGLPGNAALPPVALTIIVGMVWIHWLLPKILPDFQTESFTASATLAALVGIGELIGGIVTGAWTGGYLF